MKKVRTRIRPAAQQPAAVNSRRAYFPGAVATAVIAVAIAAASVVSAQSNAHLGTTPVTVMNTALVRDINNPSHDPFGKRLYPSAASAATFVVPAGKRLVITHLAAFSYGSTTLEDFALYTTTNGVGSAVTVPVTVNNHGIVYADSEFHAQADASTTVTVGVDDTNGSDSAGMNVDLEGYYVDAP